MRLPGQCLQPWHVGKVRVPGCDRQVPLPGGRRYPEVIVRNWFADTGKLGFESAVGFGRALVGQQEHDRPHKAADLSQSFLWPNRSLTAKKEFAEHYPRNIECLQPGR